MPQSVFIHGFLGQPSDWDTVRSRIEHDSQSIRIPVAADWDETVQAVLDSLPTISRLVGYSMGGRIAIGCAVAAPERVEKLVAVSANPGISQAARPQRLQNDSAIATSLRACSTSTSMKVFLENWYRQPVFAGLTDPQIAELVERRSRINPSKMGSTLDALTIAKQPDFHDALGSIGTQTLFIAGDRDEKYSTIAQSAARLSSRIHFEIIPDCGHAIPFEQPIALASVIDRFLN